MPCITREATLSCKYCIVHKTNLFQKSKNISVFHDMTPLRAYSLIYEGKNTFRLNNTAFSEVCPQTNFIIQNIHPVSVESRAVCFSHLVFIIHTTSYMDSCKQTLLLIVQVRLCRATNGDGSRSVFSSSSRFPCTVYYTCPLVWR